MMFYVSYVCYVLVFFFFLPFVFFTTSCYSTRFILLFLFCPRMFGHCCHITHWLHCEDCSVTSAWIFSSSFFILLLHVIILCWVLLHYNGKGYMGGTWVGLLSIKYSSNMNMNIKVNWWLILHAIHVAWDDHMYVIGSYLPCMIWHGLPCAQVLYTRLNDMARGTGRTTHPVFFTWKK